MRRALEASGVRPEEVDYVSAHGTGTRANDKNECEAMRRVFGAKIPPVSSIKSMLGHAMGAASAFEAVACALAVSEGALADDQPRDARRGVPHRLRAQRLAPGGRARRAQQRVRIRRQQLRDGVRARRLTARQARKRPSFCLYLVFFTLRRSKSSLAPIAHLIVSGESMNRPSGSRVARDFDLTHAPMTLVRIALSGEIHLVRIVDPQMRVVDPTRRISSAAIRWRRPSLSGIPSRPQDPPTWNNFRVVRPNSLTRTRYFPSGDGSSELRWCKGRTTASETEKARPPGRESLRPLFPKSWGKLNPWTRRMMTITPPAMMRNTATGSSRQ